MAESTPPQVPPETQAQIQQIYQRVKGTGGKMNMGVFHRALKDAGISPPQDYVFTPNGELVHDSGLWSQLLKAGLVTAGVAFGGPALLGAFGGAGGGSAAAGSIMGAPAGASGGLGGIGSGLSGASVAPAVIPPASKGLGSILGKAGQIGAQLGPILGGAAAGKQQSDQFDASLGIQQQNQNRSDAEFRLKEPGQRLGTSFSASKLLNWEPVKGNFAGPGSGKVTFTGGYNNPNLIDPRTKQLADKTIADELQRSLQGGELGDPSGNPQTQLPKKGGGGMMNNLLGWGATAGSILGAFRPKAY